MGRVPRVVVDTSVFVRALIGKGASARLMELFMDGAFDMIITAELFDELRNVLERPRIRRLISKNDKQRLFDLLHDDAFFVSSEKNVSACRDPADDKVLNCAVAGNADAIISNDKDLLSMKIFRKIPIVSPSEFLKLLAR